jgi:glycosyltransferase involved in cell wall biosynthesis
VKSAIIAFYEVYPPISGAAVVSFNVAKFLSGEKLLIQVGSRPWTTEVHGVRTVTIPGAAESRIGKITGLAGRIRMIVAKVAGLRPDFVMLEGASWAMYHWMLLRSIRRVAPKVPVIYHSHNVEYPLRRARNGRAVAAITRWAEGQLIAGCDLATAVSEVDRGHFRALYNADTALLPNGVDTALFSPFSTVDIEGIRAKYNIGGAAIVFSGLYAYPPNRVAVNFLVRDVMPRLLAHTPAAQLVVTGGEIPCQEPWLIAPGIVPHDELPALLASCGVAAAPIFSGSGTRLKILEAMAAGVPVVSTTRGAEGLPFHHGEHLLVADDAGAFVGCLRRAITDSSLRGVLTARARDVVQRQFDWRVLISRFQSQWKVESGGLGNGRHDE